MVILDKKFEGNVAYNYELAVILGDSTVRNAKTIVKNKKIKYYE